jgi:hypothetical protein
MRWWKGSGLPWGVAALAVKERRKKENRKENRKERNRKNNKIKENDEDGIDVTFLF